MSGAALPSTAASNFVLIRRGAGLGSRVRKRDLKFNLLPSGPQRVVETTVLPLFHISMSITHSAVIVYRLCSWELKAACLMN